jgi:hypothetical protein
MDKQSDIEQALSTNLELLNPDNFTFTGNQVSFTTDIQLYGSYIEAAIMPTYARSWDINQDY